MTLKEGNHLEQDTIVIIPAQDTKQDIGHAKCGKKVIKQK
jgi:hypothetical protein